MRKQFYLIIIAAFVLTTSCNRRNAALTSGKKAITPPPVEVLEEMPDMMGGQVAADEANMHDNLRQRDMSKAVAPDAKTVLTFTRGACYGECPVYTLEVMADGKVNYEGKHFVENKGKFTTRISRDKLIELMTLIQENGFYQMPATYPENGQVITDLPNAIMEVNWKGRKNKVTNNHNASKDLLQIEAYLDNMIKNLSWTPGS